MSETGNPIAVAYRVARSIQSNSVRMGSGLDSVPAIHPLTTRTPHTTAQIHMFRCSQPPDRQSATGSPCFPDRSNKRCAMMSNLWARHDTMGPRTPSTCVAGQYDGGGTWQSARCQKPDRLRRDRCKEDRPERKVIGPVPSVRRLGGATDAKAFVRSNVQPTSGAFEEPRWSRARKDLGEVRRLRLPLRWTAGHLSMSGV